MVVGAVVVAGAAATGPPDISEVTTVLDGTVEFVEAAALLDTVATFPLAFIEPVETVVDGIVPEPAAASRAESTTFAVACTVEPVSMLEAVALSGALTGVSPVGVFACITAFEPAAPGATVEPLDTDPDAVTGVGAGAGSAVSAAGRSATVGTGALVAASAPLALFGAAVRATGDSTPGMTGSLTLPFEPWPAADSIAGPADAAVFDAAVLDAATPRAGVGVGSAAEVLGGVVDCGSPSPCVDAADGAPSAGVDASGIGAVAPTTSGSAATTTGRAVGEGASAAGNSGDSVCASAPSTVVCTSIGSGLTAIALSVVALSVVALTGGVGSAVASSSMCPRCASRVGGAGWSADFDGACDGVSSALPGVSTGTCATESATLVR